MAKKNKIVPLGVESGVLESDQGSDLGFFCVLPEKGVSLNEYKKLHFGAINRYVYRYKSIFDVCLLSLFNNELFSFGEHGLFMKTPLVKTCHVRWSLSFGLYRLRDNSNYVQKIMMDAFVMTGVIKDDNLEIVKSDNVSINTSRKSDTVVLVVMPEDNDWTNHLNEGVMASTAEELGLQWKQ